MAVADAMAWALHSSGIQYLLHYLDDFLFVGPPGSQDAAIAGQVATAVFHELGMPVAVHKTEGLATQVTFLGFQVDTLACQLRIPDDKLACLQDLVHEWCNKQSCTRKEFVLLLGHLSHASIAVRHERLYLRQLFALLSSAHQPFYYVRFNRSAWADIAWWLFFLKEWNGVSLSTRAHLSHYVFGCFGVVWLWCCGSRWCLVQWPPHWLSVDITVFFLFFFSIIFYALSKGYTK